MARASVRASSGENARPSLLPWRRKSSPKRSDWYTPWLEEEYRKQSRTLHQERSAREAAEAAQAAAEAELEPMREAITRWMEAARAAEERADLARQALDGLMAEQKLARRQAQAA